VWGRIGPAKRGAPPRRKQDVANAWAAAVAIGNSTGRRRTPKRAVIFVHGFRDFKALAGRFVTGADSRAV
ncbi:MAG: hypothetical protein ACLPN5_04810, partial [Roseiarcus sp.]